MPLRKRGHGDSTVFLSSNTIQYVSNQEKIRLEKYYNIAGTDDGRPVGSSIPRTHYEFNEEKTLSTLKQMEDMFNGIPVVHKKAPSGLDLGDGDVAAAVEKKGHITGQTVLNLTTFQHKQTVAQYAKRMAGKDVQMINIHKESKRYVD